MSMDADADKRAEQPRAEQPGEEPREPRGLGARTHGLASEYAHEQGWGTNVEERTTAQPVVTGGNDYDYGSQDFGEVPSDRKSVQPTPESTQFLTGQQREQEEK